MKITIESNSITFPVDGFCPDCGALLSFEYENNGFSAPDPEYWEISRVWCEHCGWEGE